ncbi:hypothetical protein EJ04DRAFT_601533 [Polyplosphaeria fusca]|uniref:Uncharacterized protein n=1 Tax=Polyplosphaeria fusca TaxID=682080 RepID=A0A9P4R245_9PLEO|nr:hypothetical protein EJ04DRAFT_601533 [Polyplosphaeria fusca]
MYLLFNATSNTTGDAIQLDWVPTKEAPVDWTRTSSGPWPIIAAHNASSESHLGLNVTLCFATLSHFSPSEVKVKTWGLEDDHLDLTIAWNATTGSYLTRKIRGMPARFPSARHPTSEAYTRCNRSRVGLPSSTIRPRLVSRAIPRTRAKGWHRMKERSTVDTDSSIHLTHSTIFLDILRDTRNTALALQSMLTAITQTAYYDQLPLFDTSALATWSVSEKANTPVRWTGFTVVMALPVVHFVLVAAAIGLFLARAESSLLGDAWQAVTQAAAGVPAADAKARDVADGEMRRFLR